MARRALVLLMALGLLLLGVLLDAATGPAMLPVGEVACAVFGYPADSSVQAIVWSIRLPVALMAIAVGAALGLSGAIMQAILNNPLASSYTLGISAGAGFGASLVIVLGISLPVPDNYAIASNAILFAGVACAGVYWIGGARKASAEGLVLAGIALLFLFQGLSSLLQMVASPESLQQVVFWLFGSLQKSTWPKFWAMLTVLVVCVPWLARDVWGLTALKLGDARAAALGVNVSALRIRSFVLISALTGVAVAFVGTIGFVGLVAPHLARMLIGEDQRGFLPASGLLGAVLLSLASVASKTISPGAIFPIGIVTSLIGVPFFIWMVLRNRKSYW
ncbi:iron ABC transporter permease [Rhodoferax fermentans]|uniref:Iron ABC transporter permease n=2 Tax=Rhodoferax fermentans TaxID=28066 RepID=A0A1T1AY01_RHOFE|nr:iron ABC transporter permease [Rhodoferax fermentans]MBK1683203.1 iron ABC transporter permease [Rhodoferax fermentans]OOV08994.1 iron ABC transporter permease [Rhodoferax fermentans]